MAETILGPNDYEVDPPENFDVDRIRRDLMNLQYRGLSIERYVKSLSTRWYYNRHKAKMEALAELVRSSTSLMSALIDFGLETARFSDINQEIKFRTDSRRKDWQIKLTKQDLELKELQDALAHQPQRSDMKWDEEQKRHDVNMSELDKKLGRETQPREGSSPQGKPVDKDEEAAQRKIKQMRLEMKVAEEWAKLQKEWKEKLKSAGYSEQEIEQMLDDLRRDLFERPER